MNESRLLGREVTSSGRRRLVLRIRPVLALLAVGLLLSWVVAAVLAFTIDPRRGTARVAESWRAPDVFTVIETYEGAAWSYAEARLERGAKRSWGTEQATGVPDTPGQGDHATAWAPASQDGQTEWLTVRWMAPVDAVEILVFQSCNPGAITRIAATAQGAKEEIVWNGGETGVASPALAPELRVPLEPVRRVEEITVHLDTGRIPGWNEIDAVCVRDRAGVLHSADDASASSTYADRGASGGSVPLKSWSSRLSTPSRRFERGEVLTEQRAECAFGWPLPAWVATQTLEGGAGAGPAAASIRVMPPVGMPLLTRGFAPVAPGASGPLRAVPYRPILGAVAVNTLTYAVVVAALVFALFKPIAAARRLLRMQRGWCPRCGYDLKYGFAHGCAECGLLREQSAHPAR